MLFLLNESMKLNENMKKIYNKINNPKILLPIFEKTVSCISTLSVKSI